MNEQPLPARNKRLLAKLDRLVPPQLYWLAWLLPLLPLIYITDATAVLWLGGTAIMLLLIRSARAATFSLVFRNIATSVLIGAAVGCALHFVIDPLIIPLGERLTGSAMDLTQFAAVEGDAGEYMTLLIVALLFGGIIEEVTFRGFFIGWGAGLFGRKWAIPLAILVAVIFGAGHWYQGPTGAIATGVGGLVFGLTYVLCDRKLLPAITAHMTANFWGVTSIYLYGV